MKDKSIEIHIICYNEQVMLPFTIDWYNTLLRNHTFIVHDNGSTDKTLEICKENSIEVRPFVTEGMNDTIQSQIKSKAVLESKVDYVLCIDADECCLITQDEINELDVDIVKFQGWDIFDTKESPWEVIIPKGCQSPGYSKSVLVKGNTFEEFKFAAGAHSIDSCKLMEERELTYSLDEYKLLHYKHWSSNYNINRSAELAKRQSKDNLAKRHSFHFSLPKSVHQQWFDDHYKVSEVIIDERLNLFEI